VVADILSLNNLESGDVQPGQELAIPAEYAH
jgi:LysM repeat protein